MCVTFWQQNASSTYNLILVFNRDEFFNRPTRPFHHWTQHPTLFAPQDLQPSPQQRGTWIGINNQQGQLALLTNFREPHYHHKDRLSRGTLVRDYLVSGQSAWDYGQQIQLQQYDGFNLVLFDNTHQEGPVYVTNRPQMGSKVERLANSGTVGLSNSTVNDMSWPKVQRGIGEFDGILADNPNEDELIRRLMAMMAQCTSKQPETLDDLKQSLFVPKIDSLDQLPSSAGPYGTRSTTLILRKSNNAFTVAERNYPSDHIEITHLF